ncbi:MAG: universal stress protein, partial [Thermoleophilia bacterium]|nr:universal stress protein [Thermoleophilia bacterium]
PRYPPYQATVSTAGGVSLVFTRIFAATDGTEASLRGVEVAADMVASCGCEFVLLTVVSVPQHVVLAANMDQRTVERYVERAAQSSLGSAFELLRRKGVGAEVKAVVGPAAETILSEIEASGADLVVMGRRGRQEPKDLILGSVSYRVSRHVRVPILLVP